MRERLDPLSTALPTRLPREAEYVDSEGLEALDSVAIPDEAVRPSDVGAVDAPAELSAPHVDVAAEPELEVADGFERTPRTPAAPSAEVQARWTDEAVEARVEEARTAGRLTDERAQQTATVAESVLDTAPNDWPVRLTGTDVASALNEAGASMPANLEPEELGAIVTHLNSSATLAEQRVRLDRVLQDLSSRPPETATVPTEKAPEEAPPDLLLWADGAVEIQHDAGVRQGALGEDTKILNEAMVGAVYESIPTDATTEFTADDIGYLVQESGGKVDPRQLQAAASYVNRGNSVAEQKERLQRTLDNFAILNTAGAPKLEEEEFVQSLWAAAKIPRHAVDGFNEEKKENTFQEVSAALLTPGENKFKIDNYNVTLKVSEDNEVTDSSTKKPGIPWAKIALNVAIAVAGVVTGGVAAIAIRTAMSAYSAVRAIQAGSVLGAVAGIAGAFAGGITIGAGAAMSAGTKLAATIADTTARAARATQSALSAIQGGSGAGIIGAIADGAGAAAGALANSASSLSERLSNFSERASQWGRGASAVENAVKGDYVDAVGAGLSFAGSRMDGATGARMQQVGRAVSLAEGNDTMSMVAAASQLGAAFTDSGRLDQTSTVLTAASSAVTAQRVGDPSAPLAMFELGQSVRENRTLFQRSSPKPELRTNATEAAPEVPKMPGTVTFGLDGVIGEQVGLPTDPSLFAMATPEAPALLVPSQSLDVDPSAWATLAGVPALAAPSGVHTVKRGDSLEAIAADAGLSVADLRRANPNLRGDRIDVGQVLFIPSTTSDSRGAEALANFRRNAPSQLDNPEGNFTVAAGMTLPELARKNPHLTEAEIFRLNSRQIGADGRLFAGQRLNVPTAEQIRILPNGQKGYVTPEQLQAEKQHEAAVAAANADAIKRGQTLLEKERQYVRDIHATGGLFRAGLGAATNQAAREYDRALAIAQDRIASAKSPEEIAGVLRGLEGSRQNVKGFEGVARSWNEGSREFIRAAVPTAAAIAAIPLTGGMSGAAAVSTLAGVGAASRVGTNALLDGENYTTGRALQDTFIGAVQGGTVFVGNGAAAGAGRVVLGLGERAGLQTAARVGAAATTNAIEGALGGAAGGGLEAMVTAETYRDGAANAVRVIGTQTRRGAVMGAVGGGTLGGLGGAWADGLVGAGDDLARGVHPSLEPSSVPPRVQIPQTAGPHLPGADNSLPIIDMVPGRDYRFDHEPAPVVRMTPRDSSGRGPAVVFDFPPAPPPSAPSVRPVRGADAISDEVPLPRAVNQGPVGPNDTVIFRATPDAPATSSRPSGNAVGPNDTVIFRASSDVPPTSPRPATTAKPPDAPATTARPGTTARPSDPPATTSRPSSTGASDSTVIVSRPESGSRPRANRDLTLVVGASAHGDGVLGPLPRAVEPPRAQPAPRTGPAADGAPARGAQPGAVEPTIVADDLPGASPTPAPSRGIDDLGRESLDGLTIRKKLNQGGQSNAYELDDGRVLVLQKRADPREPLSSGAKPLTPDSAEFLRNQLDYMVQAQHLQYRGHSIPPRIHSIVEDGSGGIAGYTVEKINGRELGELAAEGKLTKKQMDEVERQARDQLKILHDAGFIHGDPNSQNMLVHVGRDRSVTVRMIDFEPPNSSFGPADDRDLLDRALSGARFDMRPERVRAHREFLARTKPPPARAAQARAIEAPGVDAAAPAVPAVTSPRVAAPASTPRAVEPSRVDRAPATAPKPPATVAPASTPRFDGPAPSRYLPPASEVKEAMARLARGEPLTDAQADVVLAEAAFRVREGLVTFRPSSEDFDGLTVLGVRGACGLATSMAYHRLRELGVAQTDILVHQAMNLFRDSRGARHVFAVAKMPNGKNYIVDTTVRQFFEEATAGQAGSFGHPGALMRSLPGGDRVADTLLSQGYVELTDETARIFGYGLSGGVQQNVRAEQFLRRATDAIASEREEVIDALPTPEQHYGAPNRGSP